MNNEVLANDIKWIKRVAITLSILFVPLLGWFDQRIVRESENTRIAVTHLQELFESKEAEYVKNFNKHIREYDVLAVKVESIETFCCMGP